MPDNHMHFQYGLPKMALVLDDVVVPFTRFNVDWRQRQLPATPQYKSILQSSTDICRRMAESALDDLMSGGAARTHSGQTTSGLIASGLSASTLRVPEINTGLLMAVSL